MEKQEMIEELEEHFGNRWPADLKQVVAVVGGQFPLLKSNGLDRIANWNIYLPYLHNQSSGMVAYVYNRITK